MVIIIILFLSLAFCYCQTGKEINQSIQIGDTRGSVESKLGPPAEEFVRENNIVCRYKTKGSVEGLKGYQIIYTSNKVARVSSVMSLTFGDPDGSRTALILFPVILSNGTTANRTETIHINQKTVLVDKENFLSINTVHNVQLNKTSGERYSLLFGISAEDAKSLLTFSEKNKSIVFACDSERVLLESSFSAGTNLHLVISNKDQALRFAGSLLLMQGKK